jgi:hypothetical protein
MNRFGKGSSVCSAVTLLKDGRLALQSISVHLNSYDGFTYKSMNGYGGTQLILHSGGNMNGGYYGNNYGIANIPQRARRTPDTQQR